MRIAVSSGDALSGWRRRMYGGPGSMRRPGPLRLRSGSRAEVQVERLVQRVEVVALDVVLLQPALDAIDSLRSYGTVWLADVTAVVVQSGLELLDLIV